MDVWIQRSLFDEPGIAAPDRIALTRPAASQARRRGSRVDRSRVTRDPAVAMSYSRSAQVASDFRVGLARAFGQLTAEQREAFRAMLSGERARPAA